MGAVLLIALAVVLSACQTAPQPAPPGGPPDDPPPASNEAPVANAGADQVVDAGSAVHLDGSASADPDGDDLTFAWDLTSKPPASAATLNNATTVAPWFVVDEPGSYEATLTVSDGELTDTATVTVRTNGAPLADAGADVTTSVGTAVSLDGSASSDPDGDPLAFAWEFVTTPPASSAALTGADTATPEFVPDAAGVYIVELTVSDGSLTSTDRVSVEAFAGSTPSNVLYVSPSGSDGAAGSQADPFRTLGKALAVAHAEATVNRISLAPGTYSEPFGYQLEKTLQISGPSDPTTPAVLTGNDDLFAVGSAADPQPYVTLQRLTLESGKTAVYVGEDAGVSLDTVACEAKTCVAAGSVKLILIIPVPDETGGKVSIKDSTLTGRGDGTGVLGVATDDLNIRNTTISGFGNGVLTLMSRLYLSDSTVSGNFHGVELLGGENSQVIATTLEDNSVAIATSTAKNLRVQSSTVTGDTPLALEVGGGSTVTVANSTLLTNGGSGAQSAINVTASGSGGEVLTLRGTTVRVASGTGAAVRLRGKLNTLDLGNSTQAGNNSLLSNSGSALRDERPDTATGVISLSATTLNSAAPPAGTYSGPAYSGHGLSIENATDVIVY